MRVALVTGSSRGLGRAIAERLARDGLAVAVNDRRGQGEPVAAAIRERGRCFRRVRGRRHRRGGGRGARRCDRARARARGCARAQRDRAAARRAARRGRWRDHLDQLEFFVKSPVLLGRAVLPGMRERGWGRIVQVDSEVVDRPPPGRSAYAAAKAAQIGLTRAWARELAPDGITVNTVAPGFVPVSGTPTCRTPTATPTSPPSPPAASARPPRSRTRSVLRGGGGSVRHRPEIVIDGGRGLA